MGSGNIGATNVLRAGGKGLGAATFLLDVLKGCAAVWLGALIAHRIAPALDHYDVQALAALCAVLGHMFPVWLRFRGGKGVATAFGVFLVAAPLAALSAIAVFARHSRAHPLCLAGLRPRRCHLSRLCLAPDRRRSSPIFLRRRNRRCPAHHPQAPPERPPPARGHGIPPRSPKNRMSRIVVLGSGAWGTAIALSLHRRGGHQITLWAHSTELAGQIVSAQENSQFLPGFPIPSPDCRYRRLRGHRCRRHRRLRHPFRVPARHFSSHPHPPAQRPVRSQRDQGP